MKKFIYTLLFLCSFYAFSQTNKSICDCANNDFTATKAETTFQLSSGKIIALCGYKNPETNPITYSEFVLSECGKEHIIDFWDALTTCEINIVKDTLKVNELINLPNGENFKHKENVWNTENIFYEKLQLHRVKKINKNITKFSKIDQQIVIDNYKNAPIEISENTMEIANQLFVASISGNKKARKYFKNFIEHFGILDGAFSEEYHFLNEMLNDWDNKKK